MIKCPTEKNTAKSVNGNTRALTTSKVYLNYVLQFSKSVIADLAIKGDVFQVQLLFK